MEILRNQCYGGDLAQADLHHTISDAGQVQDFGGAVHAGVASVVQDVVEQAAVCVEADDLAQTQGRDVGVVEGGTRAVCAIGQCADFVHRIHQGLHFGRAVHRAGVDGGGVEHLVDEADIGVADTRHACVGIDRRGECSARHSTVVLCRRDDGVHRLGDVVHQGPQGGLGGDGRDAAVGRFECAQHSGQVGVGDAAGEAVELRNGGRSGGRGVVITQHDFGGVGQGLQLGHGVHIGRIFAVHHIADQGGAGCVDASHAQVGVIGDGGGCGAVAIGAVGGVEHFVVSVDNGLQLGGRIGFGAIDHSTGQCVVDGADIGRGHTGHARSGVGGCSGRSASGLRHTRNVVLSEAAEGANRHIQVIDQALQFGQRIGLAAIVGLSCDGGQHGPQVVRRNTAQTDQGEVGCSQCRRGCATGREGLDGIGDAGQFVDLGYAVHPGQGLGPYQVVEQCEVLQGAGRRTDDGTERGILSCTRVHAGCGIGRHAVGFTQNRVVGIDNGLHLRRRVGQAGINARAVECAVDGGQVDAGHTADAGCAILRGVGADGAGAVVLGRIADGSQGCGVTIHGLVDQVLQFSLRGYRNAIRIGGGQGGQHSRQVVCGDGTGAANCSVRQCVELIQARCRLALPACVGSYHSHRVGQGLHL